MQRNPPDPAIKFVPKSRAKNLDWKPGRELKVCNGRSFPQATSTTKQVTILSGFVDQNPMAEIFSFFS